MKDKKIIASRKRSRIKKQLSVIFSALLLLCTVSMMFSCASNMTDDEARNILGQLVPLSQELNEIFWGEGLPVDFSEELVDSVTADQYRPVTADAEYQSIQDIKDAAEKVFSLEYLKNVVYATAFGEYDVGEITKDDIQKGDGTYYDASDLGLNTIYPRYKQERDGILCRNVSQKAYELNTEVLTDTAVVKKRANNLIVCEVKCICSGVESTMNIALRCQNGVWLLDGPTY